MKYACRLVNIIRGIEAIRVASIIVDADNYKGNNIKNNLNVNTVKVINKTVRNDNIIKGNVSMTTGTERYIRSYYDVTNLVAKTSDDIVTYPQGKMTLRLHRTNSNYMLKLFTINEKGVTVPYNLTGPYKYKLIFPTTSGQFIVIRPNEDSRKSADRNDGIKIANTTESSIGAQMGMGTLIFYITGEQAAQIMSVSGDSRYFALMTSQSNNGAQESTLYEGKVSWY